MNGGSLISVLSGVHNLLQSSSFPVFQNPMSLQGLMESFDLREGG